MRIYNLSMIEELAGSDTEFKRVMIQTFIEEVPNDIFAMNEAIENGNVALTYEIVHKMKPNLEMFGLNLSSEIENLEAWYKQNLKREDILLSAKVISDRVFLATKELKKDFNF